MTLLSAALQAVDEVRTEDKRKYRDLFLPKVKDFIERVQLLSWALQQYFIENYCNFLPTKSLEQINYKNRKENIVSEHSELVEDNNILCEKLQINDEEFNSSINKMVRAYKTLQDLCCVVDAKRTLEQANHEFGRYNYCDAILSINNLQNQLKSLTFEGNTGRALNNLTSQAENQLSLYTAQLSMEWEDIFTWSENKSLHYLTYSLSIQQSDPTLIQKVLKTLYKTEQLNAELGVFSDFFIEKLLHNVLRYNCDISIDDLVGALVFNIRIDLTDQNKPNYQTIFNNLTAIFEFLHSTLGSQFDLDPKFIEIFSDSIQEKFFNKIIEDCIRINLPSCDSTYQNYKSIVIELDSFNKFLIDLKFVKAEVSPLNKYIDDTECVLYNKKCDKLLTDVKILMAQSLSYCTSIVGNCEIDANEAVDDSKKELIWDLNNPVFLSSCVISQNVKKILKLIVDHIEESAKLPEGYSKQLVIYIRDIAIMYQCFVPKKFKVNLECYPLDIALFFNNCFYLAHGLVGPPWKTVLPSTLADLLNITLLECIQDLRVLALEKLSLYLQNQKNIIIQDIQLQESSTWTQETFEVFDTAINKATNLMKTLQSNWFNILPIQMYEMSICTLAQALCQAILDRIFADSRPISEKLVHLLAVRLEDSINTIGTLFEESFKLEGKINCWSKFIRMPELLRAQLLEISEQWNKNKDKLQSFSCEEIRQIVKMRFPDDKYRLKILKEIQ